MIAIAINCKESTLPARRHRAPQPPRPGPIVGRPAAAEAPHVLTHRRAWDRLAGEHEVPETEG